ncbi:signal peptide peptidase SppA [Candidatus Kaiserbacteria bacterium]|nr:signal peptide peptidase SppA [Candidatus Kaiserbacteria bacterium]
MQRTFGREVAGVLLRAVVVVLTIFLIIVGVTAFYDESTAISDGTCNIAVYPLEGAILPFYGIGGYDLVTTPESLEAFMATAEQEPYIEGVLVEINSPGGTPVASERIAERLRTSTLPVIGLAGDMAASGAYMVAAATDYLIASPMSEVGSIGVNMSYVEESQKNEDEGLTYVQLTTGKFKDAGSPNRPITDEERALFMQDLEIVHNYFVDLVAKYRNLPREDVATLADGAAMTGTRALDAHLIDGLGGRAEAANAFATLLGKDISEIHFCEYKSDLLPF